MYFYITLYLHFFLLYFVSIARRRAQPLCYKSLITNHPPIINRTYHNILGLLLENNDDCSRKTLVEAKVDNQMVTVQIVIVVKTKMCE